MPYKDLEYIEYNYTDSSVPPEFHRSYKIKITKDKISIVVDSYGDIITKRAFKLTKVNFNKIQTAVEKIDFDFKFPSLRGCTGGVGREFIVKNETETKKISVYYCGGLPTEKSTLAIDKAATVILSTIPNFDKLLKR